MTPMDAAATTAAMADTARNPVQAGTFVVHVALKFSGVNFDPAAFRAALDTTYPTVASDKDSLAHGIYEFLITP